MAFNLNRSDTLLSHKLEQAGVASRAAVAAEDLVRRVAMSFGRDQKGAIERLERLVLKDVELLLELLGGRSALRQVLTERLAAAQRHDGAGGHCLDAGSGHADGAPALSPVSDDEGQFQGAGDGQRLIAPSFEPHREAGGHSVRAGDGQMIVAPASRPTPAPKVRSPFQADAAMLRATRDAEAGIARSLSNALTKTYVVGDRPIGDWNVKHAWAWANRQIPLSRDELVRATVMRRVLERTSIDGNGDKLIHEIVTEDRLAEIIRTSRDVAAAEIAAFSGEAV